MECGDFRLLEDKGKEAEIYRTGNGLKMSGGNVSRISYFNYLLRYFAKYPFDFNLEGNFALIEW